jgi:hypothetical protein
MSAESVVVGTSLRPNETIWPTRNEEKKTLGNISMPDTTSTKIGSMYFVSTLRLLEFKINADGSLGTECSDGGISARASPKILRSFDVRKS